MKDFIQPAPAEVDAKSDEELAVRVHEDLDEPKRPPPPAPYNWSKVSNDVAKAARASANAPSAPPAQEKQSGKIESNKETSKPTGPELKLTPSKIKHSFP